MNDCCSCLSHISTFWTVFVMRGHEYDCSLLLPGDRQQDREINICVALCLTCVFFKTMRGEFSRTSQRDCHVCIVGVSRPERQTDRQTDRQDKVLFFKSIRGEFGVHLSETFFCERHSVGLCVCIMYVYMLVCVFICIYRPSSVSGIVWVCVCACVCVCVCVGCVYVCVYVCVCVCKKAISESVCVCVCV
jgi:hypothetical protein